MLSRLESVFHHEPRAKGHERGQARSYLLPNEKAGVEALQLVTKSSDHDGT
jgi:hypothetical protein